MTLIKSPGILFILLGIVFIAIGVFITFFHKIPFIGKMPGDLIIKKDNFTFYFPIITCIIVSIILTILMWIISKIK